MRISARIVRDAGRPVCLAGGLHAVNVAAALVAVGPFGVDVCRGVPEDGGLSPRRLGELVAAVRAADAERSAA